MFKSNKYFKKFFLEFPMSKINPISDSANFHEIFTKVLNLIGQTRDSPTRYTIWNSKYNKFSHWFIRHRKCGRNFFAWRRMEEDTQ